MKPFFPAIVWAVLIAFLSTMPSIQLPETIIAPDKLGHLAAYCVFNLLVLWGLFRTDNLLTRNVLIATFIVTAYGIAMEFIQWAFFPNRFFEVWDMVANFFGAVLGFIAFNFFTKK